jgi:Trk K+ transport system NAD-binding subunit
MEGHVVLCGLGKVAISTLEILHGVGVPVVLIAREVPSQWARRVALWAASVVLDDDRDETALLEAGIRTARAVIIATDDDLANLETALDTCELAPQVPVVLRLYDRQLADRVTRYLPVRVVLNAGDVAAGAFVSAVLGGEPAGRFGIETSALEVLDVAATEGDEAVGRTAAQMGEQHNGAAIACHDAAEGAQRGISERVRRGDVVTLVRARHASAAGVAPVSGRKRGRRGRFWTRQHRGLVGTAGSLWRQGPPVLRYALIGLATVVSVAVVVFHVALDLSWLDSLYLTSAIVTTIGFGDISFQGAPDAVKAFGIAVMLSGPAALLIGFGAVTDYLVSQRVEQALGRPRTTLRDHVIVAGMGNLGHRIALDLHRMGHAVLAVDQKSDLRYVSLIGETIPVLHGDATDERVLHQAGVAAARAVAAVTDSDIVNLRVAEMAKSVKPDVRTVVRLFSTRLVGRLGTTALGVDAALNPSVTAGATFAASALATGVVQGFCYEGRLLMLRKAAESEVARCAGCTVGEARASGVGQILWRRPLGGEVAHVALPGEIVERSDELTVLDEYVAGA